MKSVSGTNRSAKFVYSALNPADTISKIANTPLNLAIATKYPGYFHTMKNGININVPTNNMKCSDDKTYYLNILLYKLLLMVDCQDLQLIRICFFKTL